MALAKTTQVANRCGVDLKIYKYKADGTIEEEGTPLLTIDFCNEVSWEITSDSVWATGGQTHANKIGFVNPVEGSHFAFHKHIASVTYSFSSGSSIPVPCSFCR